MFYRKYLSRPTGNTAANKDKARNADSNAGYKARETERDAERKENRPRRTGRHLNDLSSVLFHPAVIHHKSPSDQVNDCKHHDPHCIHKVPIKSDHSEALTLS